MDAPEQPLGVDDWLGTDIAASGPSRPATAPTGLAAGALPRREVSPRGVSVCVAGVHGGAGATTLTALLGGGALDAGVSWPVAGGWARPLPVLPVVLVARTHGAGLAAADRVARSWAAGQLGESVLLGVVLVDDAPQLTKTQKAAAKRLSQMTPHGWHITWQPQWRELAHPDPDIALPLRLRRTLEDIRRLASAASGDNPAAAGLTPAAPIPARHTADEAEPRRAP